MINEQIRKTMYRDWVNEKSNECEREKRERAQVFYVFVLVYV